MTFVLPMWLVWVLGLFYGLPLIGGALLTVWLVVTVLVHWWVLFREGGDPR